MAQSKVPKEKGAERSDKSGKSAHSGANIPKRTKYERKLARKRIRESFSHQSYARKPPPLSQAKPHVHIPEYEPVAGALRVLKKSARLTNRKKERYLLYLERYGAPALAASKVGVSTKTVMNYKGSNKEYAIECDDAEERYFERLQIEAMDRIENGSLTTEKKKVKNGKHVIVETKTIRRQSDAILKAMMDRAERRQDRKRTSVIKGQIKENEEGGMNFVIETPVQVANPSKWEETFGPGVEE